MLKFAIIAAVLSLLLGGFGFTQLSRHPQTAFACSIALPERSIDMLAGQADAVALFEVRAAGGPENNAPVVTRENSRPNAPIQSFDLTGYGASVHVIDIYSGSLPVDFELDQGRRREMERGLRQQEAGFASPCPLNLFATRFVTGGRYVALLDKDGAAVSTILAYRVDGDQAVVADKFAQVGEGPEPLLVSKTLFQRYLPTILARAFDPDDDTRPASELGPYDPIWTTSAGEVPLDALINTIVAAQPPMIRPPETGEGLGD